MGWDYWPGGHPHAERPGTAASFQWPRQNCTAPAERDMSVHKLDSRHVALTKGKLQLQLHLTSALYVSIANARHPQALVGKCA